MARVEEEEISSLMEEREEEMVSLSGSQQPIKRKGLFLKPTSISSNLNSQNTHFAPSSYEPISSRIREAPKAELRWWADPQDQWSKWVEKIRPKYMDLWKKAGIFDAIQVSTYKFRRDPSSLWGVISFWCGETNTFIFPWGEATVTLEDVMILGGFSVMGEPVRVGGDLDGELAELEAEMISQLREIYKKNCRKPYHSVWMKQFMEGGEGGALEHIAFLSLWLSRFVFPEHPGKVMRSYVFPVAIRLARGARIALAPAVLASLYRGLRVLKDHLVGQEASSLVVQAPFNMLQLWLWDRFMSLSPKSRSFTGPDEPRAARWHNVGRMPPFSFVMSILESPNEFQWRPFASSLINRCKLSICKGDSKQVFGNVTDDKEELGSFARCLRACELVGLDCIEQYLPHRVAMQFGLDQDVPCVVPRANLSWEVAWETYDLGAKIVKCYFPSQLHEPDVNLLYCIWWKNFQIALRKKLERKKKMKNQSVFCDKKRKVQDLYDTMISDRIGELEKGCLVEEREENMVAFIGSNEPIKRKGWFLKPTSALIHELNSPCVPSYPKDIYPSARESPVADFRWWADPQVQWSQWVEKLRPTYKGIWKKIGIFDAIRVSTYKFRRDPSSLAAVVRFWCEETNTFIFPWAEATVTLEDVVVIGGFSLLGEPIRAVRPVEGRFKEIESEILRQLKNFNRNNSNYHSMWLRQYMEGGKGDELEHIAFLSLWLSRFVFPAPPGKTVRMYVIPIAVRLASGTRIALAPAVLASIYRALRAMKHHLTGKGTTPVAMWAPFNIIQVWLWERFLALRPEPKRLCRSDVPRAARWDDVGRRPQLSFVMSVFESPDEIQWRPYAAPLDNWSNPLFFNVDGCQFFCNLAEDEQSKTYVRCLRNCELVGLNCIEQYLPHRVAMQFGLDQEIPKFVPRANLTWEVAWKTYDFTDKIVKIYVPPRLLESDVTFRYSSWWMSAERFLEMNTEGGAMLKARARSNGRKKTLNQSLATHVLRDVNGKQLEEVFISDPLAVQDNDDAIETDDVEISYDMVVTKKPTTICKMKRAKMRTAATDIELEMRKLKRKIALIHEEVMT